MCFLLTWRQHVARLQLQSISAPLRDGRKLGYLNRIGGGATLFNRRDHWRHLLPFVVAGVNQIAGNHELNRRGEDGVALTSVVGLGRGARGRVQAASAAS